MGITGLWLHGCEHEWVDLNPPASWRNLWHAFRSYWHYGCSKCPMTKMEDSAGRELGQVWHWTWKVPRV